MKTIITTALVIFAVLVILVATSVRIALFDRWDADLFMLLAAASMLFVALGLKIFIAIVRRVIARKGGGK